MPRVPDEYLECVVYLYPSISAAEQGERIGGSGFVVGIIEGGVDFYYVVTNRHVIEGGSTTVRFNTPSGGHIAFEFDERNWFRADDTDLAVFLIPNPDPRTFQLRAIEPGQFLAERHVKELDVGIGSEVFFAGRFVNAEGRDKNRPSLRFGTIAQTGTDIIDGVESYLIEARSIPGYSGSPVFTYTMAGTPNHVMSAGIRTKGHGPFLLGIDWSHILDYADALDDKGNRLPFKVRSNSGMMGVVPVSKLSDLLYRQDVYDMRENDPRRRRVSSPDDRQPSAASRDVAQQASDENPKHQEDFKRLVRAATRKQPQDDQT